MTHRTRILLVEGHSESARSIEGVIKKSRAVQFEVTRCCALAGAIQELSKFSFDITLLDLDLPDNQGPNTFQRIQELHPEIPIIVLSGNRNETMALKAIGRGAQDYIAKDALMSRVLTKAILFAIERHRYRNNLQAQRSLAFFALDRLTCGVILIDPFRKVLRSNQFAKAVLAEGDGLLLNAGCIRASSPCEDQCFQESLAAILSPCGSFPTLRGSHLTLSRKGKRPLALMIAPMLLESPNQEEHRNNAAIFISDPERAGATIEEILRRNYQLTKAESRLCCLILQGFCVADCSNVLGITVYTVRDHLKKIFLKTGTTRQTDLVRLLLTEPPASEDPISV